jgi:hypothetical protein
MPALHAIVESNMAIADANYQAVSDDLQLTFLGSIDNHGLAAIVELSDHKFNELAI